MDPPYESEHCPRLSRKLKGGSAGNRRGQLGVTDVDQTKKDATLKTFPGHNSPEQAGTDINGGEELGAPVGRSPELLSISDYTGTCTCNRMVYTTCTTVVGAN